MSYWDQWYFSHRRLEPSAFARWASEFLQPSSVLLEVGCGDGVDAAFYAQRGHHVTATDPAQIKWPESTNPRFIRATAADSIRLSTWDCIIARFVLHAIPEDDARILLEEAARGLNPGGVFACEFRVSLDGVVPDHYRRAVDPDEPRTLLLQGGLSIEHDSVNKGTSHIGDDDPMLGRIVARSNGLKQRRMNDDRI